jgi:DNA polymerase-3 subunit gamma/tau
MRDGLSLLDQVVSFGEGPVTAQRVREVLGLIPDDLYGELLRLTAERDSRAVFPLVDRLAEAGADFGEFVAGAGETLRAVLQVGLGGEPEGLTEGMQALVRRYASRLPPPDVVRLLTIQGGLEAQIRSSGHPRLAVELLLLRWAMMDRTVEIGEVLEALKGEGGSGKGSAAPPSAPPQLRDVASPRTENPSPFPLPPSPIPPERGPFTLDRLRAIWPAIVARAHAASPMVGTLLAETEITGVEGSTVTLTSPGGGHIEGLEHKREAIAKLLAEYVSGPVKVMVAVGEPATARSPAASRPARLTEATANAERLKLLRAKDPSLGAAVDALDLEIVE